MAAEGRADTVLSLQVLYVGNSTSPRARHFTIGPNRMGTCRKELSSWYQRVGGFLHADTQGKLTVDAEAEAFGTSPASPGFSGQGDYLLKQADRQRAGETALGPVCTGA